MMTPIDLSRLPAPNVIEALDYETILSALKAELLDADPTLADTLALESEPLVKLMQVFAYRELLLRQRVNQAAQAVMLAYANDADLDHLAALLDVERLTIKEGDPSALPPEPAVNESNSELRRRTQLSLDGLSTAGPTLSYVYHALSADGAVKDAHAFSPVPGDVTVVVLAREGTGEASPALIAQVSAAVNHHETRPLTDRTTVVSAEIVSYTIHATLHILPGPESSIVNATALEEAHRYSEEQHRIGAQVTLSGIYAALHQPGVQRVELHSPTVTLKAQRHQAPHCSAIELTSKVVDRV